MHIISIVLFQKYYTLHFIIVFVFIFCKLPSNKKNKKMYGIFSPSKITRKRRAFGFL